MKSASNCSCKKSELVLTTRWLWYQLNKRKKINDFLWIYWTNIQALIYGTEKEPSKTHLILKSTQDRLLGSKYTTWGISTREIYNDYTHDINMFWKSKNLSYHRELAPPYCCRVERSCSLDTDTSSSMLISNSLFGLGAAGCFLGVPGPKMTNT